MSNGNYWENECNKAMETAESLLAEVRQLTHTLMQVTSRAITEEQSQRELIDNLTWIVEVQSGTITAADWIISDLVMQLANTESERSLLEQEILEQGEYDGLD
jgi:predicted RNase H-like nuclease (RuvC/YqgF family)